MLQAFEIANARPHLDHEQDCQGPLRELSRESTVGLRLQTKGLLLLNFSKEVFEGRAESQDQMRQEFSGGICIALLQAAGLVKDRRQTVTCLYNLTWELPAMACGWLSSFLSTPGGRNQ